MAWPCCIASFGWNRRVELQGVMPDLYGGHSLISASMLIYIIDLKFQINVVQDKYSVFKSGIMYWHAEDSEPYNFATTFCSIVVEFCLQLYVVWRSDSCLTSLRCVSYDNCPVKVGPPLVYFNCTHCSENLGETSRPDPPTNG